MIPKGNQRAGGQGLATHLLNAYDNERVEIAEVRGAIAQDLHGAFAEWYAQAKGTKCSKYLYSMSLNPDHAQGPFTREHYYDFIRRTEDSLGLSDQPRAVVFHIKHGREHCHVVWSRIDTEKMRAVQLSHDRQKLRAVAQEYARDHNLTLPPGMRKNRGKDRFPDHAKTENLAEKQQEERTGISKQQRMEEITRAWHESTDARSFVRALADSGYILARGDRRSYVVVDLYGEIHSLSRQLSGVKSKELKARLADYPVEKLPDVAQAQDRAREKRQALLIENRRREPARKEPQPGDRAAGPQPSAQEHRDALAKAQALRRADLEGKRRQLAERHAAERKALSGLQNDRNASVARARTAGQPTGVVAFLARITGFKALTALRRNWQDSKRNRDHRQQTAALARRHKREMENFKHQLSGLTSLEKRERRSLETALRREAFRTIAAPAKTRTVAPPLTPEQQAKADRAKQLADQFRNASAPPRRGQDALELTPEQRAKIAAFRKAAQSTASAKERTGAGDAKKPPAPVTPAFNQAAGGKAAPPPGSLPAKFTEKAAPPADPRAPEVKESAREVTKEGTKEVTKEAPKEISEKTRRALELARAFREGAGPARRPEDRDRHGPEEHYRRPPPDYSIRR